MTHPPSRGPIYTYEVPLGAGDLSAWLRMPRELNRADAEKLKRVIDALAFDDEVLHRWDEERAVRQVAGVVLANLIRLWIAAPAVALIAHEHPEEP